MAALETCATGQPFTVHCLLFPGCSCTGFRCTVGSILQGRPEGAAGREATLTGKCGSFVRCAGRSDARLVYSLPADPQPLTTSSVATVQSASHRFRHSRQLMGPSSTHKTKTEPLCNKLSSALNLLDQARPELCRLKQRAHQVRHLRRPKAARLRKEQHITSCRSAAVTSALECHSTSAAVVQRGNPDSRSAQLPILKLQIAAE